MGHNSSFKTNFWMTVKRESDSIHQRIDRNGGDELVENAKQDAGLLAMCRSSEFKFDNGGAVHFAISNVGSLRRQQKTQTKTTQQQEKGLDIQLREFYFNTPCLANRWNALVFHGLGSVGEDGRLCWTIAYNSKYLSQH